MKPWGQLTNDEKNQAANDAIGGNTVIKGEVADWIRASRVREQWERYDSIVIGPGARDLDKGWFNNWEEFANADEIAWFTGRSSSVGIAFSNQQNERYDYAQDLYQFGIEFIAPYTQGDLVSEPLDAQFFPMYFSKEGPNYMSFEMVLAESDNILKIPGSHAPGGVGLAGVDIDQGASPSVYPGTNGQAHVSNTWKWPSPVMIPAKGSLRVNSRISNPMRRFLTNYSGCPGNLLVPQCPPDPNGATNTLPLFYVIRVTHRGPRYLQLRGARSA
jgi:hypothetical protein